MPEGAVTPQRATFRLSRWKAKLYSIVAERGSAGDTGEEASLGRSSLYLSIACNFMAIAANVLAGSRIRQATALPSHHPTDSLVRETHLELTAL